MEFIDLKRQYREYQTEIDERIRAVLEHGQFILGPEVGELEEALAKRVGVGHAITVSNGTASLEIALRALGVGPGDEVITVPLTWISSAEVIKLVGATPAFVDIEPQTFNLDPGLLETAVTERTKAVIAVNLFGQMADYRRINAIAGALDLTVIEDAGQSFGASRDELNSCGATSIGSTSFFPAKPLGCYGDGGALFTNDDSLAERMSAIRTHGGRRHDHRYVGTNGRLDTLQAAVLLAKLPHFEHELAERRRIGKRYSQLLKDVCEVPPVGSGSAHVYAYYTIRIPRRDRVAASLKAQGIPTAVYYPRCLHEQPVFADLGYRRGDFPVAERASHEVLSLPMHPFLSDSEQDRIVGALEEAIAGAAGKMC